MINTHNGNETLWLDMNRKPALIAGPCALESETVTRQIAQVLKRLSVELDCTIIFKGSYTKANRTRENSYHGVGLEKGLQLLSLVKREFNLPVTSDVHEEHEIAPAAEVLDVIQIPAMLCKNTAILHAAGDTGKIVNIKKAYFITAADMIHSIEKVTVRGNEKVVITERGTQFGYTDTIVDFRAIETLKSFGYPVIFDATHSVRITSKRSEDAKGGTPESIGLLTRCAAAAGCDGLFLETHFAPSGAPCDSVVCYPLHKLEELYLHFIRIRTFIGQLQERSNRSIDCQAV